MRRLANATKETKIKISKYLGPTFAYRIISNIISLVRSFYSDSQQVGFC